MRRSGVAGLVMGVALGLLTAGAAEATPGVPDYGPGTVVSGPSAVAAVTAPDWLSVYIADGAGIERYDYLTQRMGAPVSTLTSFGSLAVSSDGVLFASQLALSRVLVYSPSIETTRFVALTDDAASPSAIAVSPNGATLYVASMTTGSISVVDVATGATRRTVPAPAGVTTASHLALTADGETLFVATGGEGEIWSLDTHTDATRVVITGLGPLRGLAAVDERTAYVGLDGGSPAVAAVDVARGAIFSSTPLAAAPSSLSMRADELLVTEPSLHKVVQFRYPVAPRAQLQFADVRLPAIVGKTDEVFVKPVPAGITVTYQWYADGRLIEGATSRAYELTEAEIGAKMTVAFITHGVGLATNSDTLTDMDPVLAPMAPRTPTISGRALVGHTVTARTGSWGRHTKVRFFYQWYAGTKAIPGANRATLRVKKSVNGKRLRVRVTGREYAAKHTVASAYSKKVRKRS